MAQIRQWTDRQVERVKRVIRRAENPPSPQLAQHYRARNIRNVDHHHNHENRMGVTDQDIGVAQSGFVTLSVGPHPLEKGVEKVTAYNYCGGTITQNSLVVLRWMIVNQTGGFWLAVPCTGTASAPTAECALCAGGIPDPLSVTFGGVTDGNDAGSAAALNATHSLAADNVLTGACENGTLVHGNDYLVAASMTGSTGAFKWRVYIEKQSGGSWQNAYESAVIGEVSNLANCAANYPNSSGWTHLGPASKTEADGPDFTNLTIEINP